LIVTLALELRKYTVRLFNKDKEITVGVYSSVYRIVSKRQKPADILKQLFTYLFFRIVAGNIIS
jgi:hypothetical protein